jgi:hypothetical protein
MTEEDEAFNEIERQAKQRKEAVRATTQTWRESASDYERGFIDGMQKQTQSDVTRIMEGGTRNAPSKKWHSTLRSSKALVKTL